MERSSPCTQPSSQKDKIATSLDAFTAETGAFLAAWFGFAWVVLEELRLTPDAVDVERTQLWPGHFDPALAMGLAGINDWTTQHPFINRMKTARRWTGHLPGQWGGVDPDEMEARGLLDENGWVWGIPGDIEAVEALLPITCVAEQAWLMIGNSHPARWEHRDTFEFGADR